MIAQIKLMLARDPSLAVFDDVVDELLDLATLDADDMIMMTSLVQLELRLATLEVVTMYQPRSLELRQDPVDGR